jgi:hypothetical protein
MRLFALVLMCLAPFPALALTCVRPAVERTYAEVDAAPEHYVVVRGRLTLDPRKLPKDGSQQSSPPSLTLVPARLVGKSMTASGFAVPFEHRLMLEVACLGPWCGSAVNGQEVLAFVRREGGDYALAVNPCGGHVFGNPTAAQVKQALACHRGGACGQG